MLKQIIVVCSMFLAISFVKGQNNNHRLVHTIKSGETLTGIALLYNVPIDSILLWNKLNGETIYAGRNLIIDIQPIDHTINTSNTLVIDSPSVTHHIDTLHLKTSDELMPAANEMHNQKLPFLVFETDEDSTMNQKTEKSSKKLEKKWKKESTSNEIEKKQLLDEVVVEVKKKKKKSKKGGAVDSVRIEKARFFLARAMMEIDKENYKKADQYLDKSIESNPNYVEALMLKGDLYASFGYIEKALKHYESAIKIDSQIAQLNYNIANCHHILKNTDKGFEHYTNAIQIDSSYVLAWAGRAFLYMTLHQYDEAVDDFNRLLDINTYFYPAYRGRGIAYLQMSDYRNAIIDLDHYVEMYQQDAEAIHYLGLAGIYSNDIYVGCLDLLKASEMGYEKASKALKKYCN